MISGSELARLEEEPMGLIGPVGSMVLERAFQDSGVRKGAAVPKKTFAVLIQAIARQVPDEQRSQFLAKFSF